MANGNLLSIMQLIRQAGRMTRKELASQLDLGPSMASKLVSELFTRGLICDAGRSETESGRPSDLLVLNPEAGYAIGLEIKATRQQAVIVNLCGEVLASVSEAGKVPADEELAMDWLEQFINRVLPSTGFQSRQIMGVGIGFGFQAIVNPVSGTVLSWTETPDLAANWKDIAVRDKLLKRLPFPHIIIDDLMRTQGIAEAQYGHTHGLDEDFIFAFADVGIGLALMFNGNAYVGPLNIAGEIGHTPIPNVEIRCNCGNVGCLETVASTKAILDRIRTQLSESSIYSVLRENNADLSIQDVIQAAENGDKLAYQVLMEAGEYFGFGLAIAVNLLGPKLIVVGGSLAKSEVYLDAARRSVRLQVLSKASTIVRVEPSQMDEFAGARGAATLVLNALFQPTETNILVLSR